MSKTAADVKKGLAMCSADECHGQHTDCPYHPELMCIRNICGDSLALIQQLEAQVPRWILVEERLPEAKLAVLGYGIRSRRYGEQDPFPSAHIVYTRGEDEGWFTYWNSEYVKVTHWMPLPEPPKEEPPC